MASFFPSVKNAAAGYTFYVSLISQANTKIAQANPTLAAGDVKIAVDDVAPANLTTLPVVDADFTKRVKVVLSQAETNGDNLTVIFNDAAGAEWCDLTINIQTVPRRFDDLAYPTTSGRSIVVDVAGLVDANVVKCGPTGVGTAQTARDLGGQLDAAVSTRASPTNITAAMGITLAAVTHTGAVIPTVTAVTNNVNAVLANAAHGGAAATAQFGGAGGITANITGNVSGNIGSVTGAVGSVTGAVGSVTGNVGGNVVGSVASVTARVTANVDQVDAAALTVHAVGKMPADVLMVAGTLQTARDLGAQLDAAVSSRMATYAQPTGFLAATFPTGTVANTTNITAGTITTATNLTTNNDKAGYALSAAGVTAVWAEVMAGTTTAVQAIRGFIAALLGKASGLDLNAPKYRNIADTKNVIDATTDANGNRSAVTLDLT